MLNIYKRNWVQSKYHWLLPFGEKAIWTVFNLFENKFVQHNICLKNPSDEDTLVLVMAEELL